MTLNKPKDKDNQIHRKIGKDYRQVVDQSSTINHQTPYEKMPHPPAPDKDKENYEIPFLTYVIGNFLNLISSIKFDTNSRGNRYALTRLRRV